VSSMEPRGKNFGARPGMPPTGSPRPSVGPEIVKREHLTITKPPVPAFVLVVLSALIPMLLLPISTGGIAQLGHGVGYILGTFGTIGALTLFILADNKKQLAGAYNGWRFSARQVSILVVMVGWISGIAHIFFYALEVSRNA